MALIAPVGVDDPAVLATQERDRDGRVPVAIDSLRQVDARADRAADELGLSATSIERLPFDLSVLDAGGVFIVRRATCG